MKRFFCLIAATLALAACQTVPTDPGAPKLQGPTVAQVQTACVIDAGIRPLVSAAIATPGVVTQAEAGLVAAARVGIDEVCADPTKPLSQTAFQAFTAATTTVSDIYTQIQLRKATAKPASAPG